MWLHYDCPNSAPSVAPVEGRCLTPEPNDCMLRCCRRAKTRPMCVKSGARLEEMQVPGRGQLRGATACKRKKSTKSAPNRARCVFDRRTRLNVEARRTRYVTALARRQAFRFPHAVFNSANPWRGWAGIEPSPSNYFDWAASGPAAGKGFSASALGRPEPAEDGPLGIPFAQQYMRVTAPGNAPVSWMRTDSLLPRGGRIMRRGAIVCTLFR
jgi:hypothetical protein